MIRVDRRSVKWLLALVIFGTAGMMCVQAVQGDQDMKRVAKMTDKMKTVCVGRFLIDVPEEANVTLDMAQLSGFEITRQTETAEAFSIRVSKHEAQLEASNNMLGRKNVELNREVRGDGYIGKIFVHSRYRGYTLEDERRVYFETVTIEGYVNKSGVTFGFKSDGDDPARVPVVASMMTQATRLPANGLPTLPGFCIDGALISDPSRRDRSESVTMFARLPGHPDFALAFWTMTGRHDGPGLLARDAAATDALTRARSRVLREGARTINGFAGEEVGVKVHELNFATVMGFEWEGPGSEDDVFLPRLTLEMESGRNPRPGGKPVQSSLSEEAMLKLWDKISSSIRLRPTTPEKAADIAPSLTPLGTYAEAGERCPQSGWWLCSEGGNGVGVLGGQRQYLREGQKMPQALLLTPQTLWQKVRGLQPSYESRTRTSWKLVDKRARERGTPVVPLAQATLVAQLETGSAIGSAFSTAQASAPIGCCAKTGMHCPASGWWRCEESAALDGTRWFAAGSLLPAATFTLPSARFGRALDKPATIVRRSVWQLVRHAPEPAADAAPAHAVPAPGSDNAPARA